MAYKELSLQEIITFEIKTLLFILLFIHYLYKEDFNIYLSKDKPIQQINNKLKGFYGEIG